jgi:hypothetical protein
MCHFHEIDEEAIERELEREGVEEAETPAEDELEEPAEPTEPAVMADGGEE